MRRRLPFPIILPALAAAVPLAPRPAAAQQAGLTLSVPQSYNFNQNDAASSGTASSSTASPGADAARRLREAPLPDPSTLPKPDQTQRDPNTGADTSPFGTAYSYANPLYGPQGAGSVQNADSKSAGTPAPQGLQFVVFQWGYPPRPMPKVPGDDLTQAPAPVAVIDFAVQADDQPVLDDRAEVTIARAVQASGRAALTRITIERPAGNPDCCRRYPELVRAALIGAGLQPEHLLPGHQVRVVTVVLPVGTP